MLEGGEGLVGLSMLFRSSSGSPMWDVDVEVTTT
jgi:hypothetical protein